MRQERKARVDLKKGKYDEKKDALMREKEEVLMGKNLLMKKFAHPNDAP